MSLNVLRGLLKAAAVLCGLGLLLLAVLFGQGSAEDFPTDEQHGKLRIAVAVAFIALVIVEAAVLIALRRVGRDR